MNSLKGAALQRSCRDLAALANLNRRARVVGSRLQSLPNAVPEFGCGRLRESNRSDSVYGRLALGYQADYAGYECRGLAGPRARLHEECLVERMLDPVSMTLVCRFVEVGHWTSSPSPSASLPYCARALSSFLPSQSRSLLEGHNRLKSQ